MPTQSTISKATQRRMLHAVTTTHCGRHYSQPAIEGAIDAFRDAQRAWLWAGYNLPDWYGTRDSDSTDGRRRLSAYEHAAESIEQRQRRESRAQRKSRTARERNAR